MLRKINTILGPLTSHTVQNTIQGHFQKLEIRMLSTTISLLTNHGEDVGPASTLENVESKQSLSKAMRSYLQRSKEHEEFMDIQRREFEIGKRHLANMMGENPETFTQEDIDNAIEYLFPSGLFEKKARPLMKPPEEVFPQRKAAEFDETGRPYNFLFYTGRPNFYQILYDAVQNINELYKFEDSMIRKNLQPDPNLTLELSGSKWFDKTSLELKLVEPLTEKEYDSFVNVMERLFSLPYSYRIKDFIMQYRKPLISHSKTYEAIKPQVGEDGRQFVTAYECRRKRAISNVTIRVPGTGKISINGEDINYFKNIQEREQVWNGLKKIIFLSRISSSYKNYVNMKTMLSTK